MKQGLFLLFICLLFSSCKDVDDCTKTGQVQIEEWFIADTAMINENIKINIKASATNLCWSDLYIELIEKEQREYSIKAYGTFTCCDGGCACPMAMLYHDTVIDFQPSQRGTYIFNISELKNRIEVDTMIVK